MKKITKLLSMILFISFIVGCSVGGETTPINQAPHNFIPEVYSPRDRIKTDDITFGSTELSINIKDPLYFYLTDSDSMVPVYHKGHNSVGIKPNSEADIERGDIIVFNFDDRQIGHRVIDIKIDDAGIYYVTKGDNLEEPDPLKIRLNNIIAVIIIIIY